MHSCWFCWIEKGKSVVGFANCIVGTSLIYSSITCPITESVTSNYWSTINIVYFIKIYLQISHPFPSRIKKWVRCVPSWKLHALNNLLPGTELLRTNQVMSVATIPKKNIRLRDNMTNILKRSRDHWYSLNLINCKFLWDPLIFSRASSFPFSDFWSRWRVFHVFWDTRFWNYTQR